MNFTKVRKPYSAILGAISAVLSFGALSAQAKVYYVSQSSGDDSASGLAQEAGNGAGPWKSLAKVSATNLDPGDRVMLKCGDTWNEELFPKGNGTPQNPIIIGYYGKGAKPVIDRQDYNQDRVGLRLADQGGYKIVGIEFNRCMTGIYAEYSDNCPTKKFIWIEDCYFHDSLMYRHYEDYPKTKIGLGICFFTFELENKKVLTDITIKNCVFRRLASGVWTNSPDNFNKNASFIYPFGNMVFEDCLFEEGYQWPQGLRGVEGGAMRNCVTHDVGRGFRSFNGVAGSMFFRCKDWVFEDSEWGFIDIGNGSGDGEAFDFEGNCDNMVMKNCLFHDTDGPGFLICCYASDGNPNKDIVMENCVINGKSKRPIGLPRAAILNTTDWNKVTWKKCRFYLSPGEALMRTMDPEKDKRSQFVDCNYKNLREACSSPNLAASAKVTASSAAADSEAAKAVDGREGSVWKAEKAADEWIEFTFDSPVTINEFRIKEDPSSKIIRYIIQYWDTKNKKWASCFNGRGIGQDFIAPIVSRTTQKVRMTVIQTSNGNPPCITEFGAYNDPIGTPFNDPTGAAAVGVVGK
jgi:hypothetical protein